MMRLMVGDGVITERERPQYMDAATGSLNEVGKQFMEKALLGTVIDDPRLMESTPKSVLQKLERSLGAVTSFASRADEWNLLPAIRAAVAELGAIQRAGSSVDLWTGQASLFGGDRNPVVDTLMRALDGKPTAVKAALDTFAHDSDSNMPGQARMFGAADAFDAFNHAFRSTLTAQEFLDGLDRAAETDPRAITQDAADHAGISGQPAGDEGAGGEAGGLGRSDREPGRAAETSQRDLETERDTVKPLAEPGTGEDNGTHGSESGRQAGERRPATVDGSANRNGVAPAPGGLRSDAGADGQTQGPDQANGAGLHTGSGSVPGARTRRGPGKRSDSSLDSAPGRPLVEAAEEQAAKPKKRNQNWYSHPDDWQVPGGALTRLDNNIADLEILRAVEKEPRKLTDQEKEVLANYLGWGALARVFASAPRGRW